MSDVAYKHIREADLLLGKVRENISLINSPNNGHLFSMTDQLIQKIKENIDQASQFVGNVPDYLSSDIDKLKRELFVAENDIAFKKANLTKHQSYDLKHFLLKESEIRLAKQKQASLNKEGMAYWANAPERNNNLVNLRVYKIEASERIQEIASEIENRFSKFLLERTPRVGDQPRGTRRTKIVPELINSSNAEESIVISGDPTERQDLPKEIQHNTMYYRWGWDRPIVPSMKGKEKERAESFLEEVDTALQQGNLEFGLQDLISRMETLRVPLMTYCHSSNLIKQGNAQDVNNLVERESMAHPQLVIGNHYINNPIIRVNNEIKQFNMQNPDKQRVDLRHKGAAIAVPNKFIGQFTSHAALSRCILAKIVSGYTLDVDGLINTIERYISERSDEYISAGMNIGEDIQQKLEALWFTRSTGLFSQMVRGYRKVEKQAEKIWNKTIVPKFDIIPELDSNGNPVLDEMGEAVPKLDSKKRKTFNFDYMGWSFSGKGQDAPGSKSYRLNVGEGRHRMTYRHLQMLLQNITVPAPQNKISNRLPIDSPDVFVDPKNRLRYSLDGMSSYYAGELRAQGMKTIGLPPLRDSESSGVDFDLKHLNLGGGHLAKNGEGALSLLSQFGPWAKKAWTRLQQQYSGMANSEVAETFKTINSGFFGAEVLLRVINEIRSSKDQVGAMQQFVNNHKTAKKTMSGTPYFVEDSLRTMSKPFKANDITTKTFIQYAYYLSKMMDFVNALMRRSSVDIINPDNGGPPIVRYGESYGTSSGIGGGGEILLSVLYAYKADLRAFAGSQSAYETFQEKTKEEQKGEIRSDLPVSETEMTNVPTSPEKRKERGITDRLTGSPHPRVKFSEDVRFWLGASSAVASSERGRARFQEIAQGHSWHEVADIAYQKFPELEENTGTIIYDQLGANVDAIEATVRAAIKKTRDALQLVDDIQYEQSDGEVEVIAGIGMPEQSQIATQPQVEIPTTPAPAAEPVPPQEQPQLTQEQPQTQPQPPMPPQPPMGNQPKMSQTKVLTQNPEYIRKRDKKKQLIKNRRNPQTGKLEHASVLERLVHVANKLDRHGANELVDKVDKLINALRD